MAEYYMLYVHRFDLINVSSNLVSAPVMGNLCCSEEEVEEEEEESSTFGYANTNTSNL